MSQEIEIEFKNMLTRSEYETLLQKFDINENQIFMQENHYFDTADFALKELQSALRIREKRNHYELTLKQPASTGLLETTQIISAEEASLAIQYGKLPKGIIYNRIVDLGIPFSNLEYFGSLVTKRVEFSYRNGLLVLDHSYYLNTEDFEVEFEVDNYQAGQQIFSEFLQELSIPERKTNNKIQRFYQQKYLQNNTN
jgi:uncharacterized protein YjbK